MTQDLNPQLVTYDKSATESSIELNQFIERLKLLLSLLEKNSYIKDTTRKLKRIIEDAESKTMILIMGKERVGKTTLINALLGRKLFPTGVDYPTTVNTLIRYGEEECLKAVFLDGVVATFDLNKSELLTASDAFLAQIIREQLDYIEIYIKNNLLKEFILIDTVALEIGGDQSAYFPETLLSRVDEIFWVLREDSVATDAELKFLSKLADRSIKPHFILNTNDCSNQKNNVFIKSEKERYGHLIKGFLSISPLNAIEAQRTHNMQLMIDSHFTEIIQLLNEISKNPQMRSKSINQRFIQWLNLFEKEMKLIPVREPFLSAVESLKKFGRGSTLESSRKQRDLAIISAYEEEYAIFSVVLQDVQTLFQLLQVIGSEQYLRDSIVESFEEKAVRYQQAVRDYRNLHSEYTLEYNLFDQQKKKMKSKGLLKTIIKDDKQNQLLEERVKKLNKLQLEGKRLFDVIREHEEAMLRELYIVQNHINENIKNRLLSINKQIEDLHVQRRSERNHIKLYANKLIEFSCIIEVQGFLRDAIKPYLLSDTFSFSEEQLRYINKVVDSICAVDLTEDGLLSQVTLTSDIETIQTDFESQYPFYSLSLTEADVISEIPELPDKIEL